MASLGECSFRGQVRGGQWAGEGGDIPFTSQGCGPNKGHRALEKDPYPPVAVSSWGCLPPWSEVGCGVSCLDLCSHLSSGPLYSLWGGPGSDVITFVCPISPKDGITSDGPQQAWRWRCVLTVHLSSGIELARPGPALREDGLGTRWCLPHVGQGAPLKGSRESLPEW